MLILIGFCAAFAIVAAYLTDLFLRDKTGFGPVALAVVLGIVISLVVSFVTNLAMDILIGFDFFIPAAIGSIFGPIAMVLAAKRARTKPLSQDDMRR